MDEDYIYSTLNPILNEYVLLDNSFVKILNYTNDKMLVDFNVPYAGKEIKLNLKLIKKQSSKIITGLDVKEIPDAPQLEVFVMSYCPYGLQMEKGVLPAYELLKNKANFKIRFVSYTMHGQKEEDENNRQICIREETNKFWPYLECFVGKGQGYESQCMEEAGINENEIENCMENRAEDYMAIDKALNEKYGVRGSPTSILDGKSISIYPRSPEEVKNAICNAFDENPPEECSTSLDSSNPSPGFGFSTSTSTSAATCG